MTTRCLTTILAVALMAFFCGRINAQQLTEQDRARYVNEIRAYKHKFLVRELGLSKDQQAPFFEVYDSMEDRLIDVVAEVRDLENRARLDGADPEAMQQAADALYSQKAREGKIEAEYYEQFKAILTPRQLVDLKAADRKFTQQLMHQHRRVKGDKSPDRK